LIQKGEFPSKRLVDDITGSGSSESAQNIQPSISLKRSLNEVVENTQNENNKRLKTSNESSPLVEMIEFALKSNNFDDKKLWNSKILTRKNLITYVTLKQWEQPPTTDNTRLSYIQYIIQKLHPNKS
jgi:hypothetical protein